jgi:hypothetical protein
LDCWGDRSLLARCRRVPVCFRRCMRGRCGRAAARRTWCKGRVVIGRCAPQQFQPPRLRPWQRDHTQGNVRAFCSLARSIPITSKNRGAN